jgi:hypothetical protein
MTQQARRTHREGEALSNEVAGAGKKFRSFKHTHVGAADAVLFATLGLPNMADADYVIMHAGESTESQGDVISIDESSIATTGFSFVGGTAAEITHILIHGRIAE